MRTGSASDVDDSLAKLAQCGREIEVSGRELQATVDELAARRRPPTCMVEWSEEVAIAVLQKLNGAEMGSPLHQAFTSLERAVAIEKGPGGNFSKGGGAA